MPIAQIRDRIADFGDRLSGSLATDASFARDLIGILDVIRLEGYDIHISVAERESSALIAEYRPTSSQNRGDDPSDKKNVPEPSRAVKCTLTAWHDPHTAIHATDMDAVFRDLAALIYRHWGERDVLTLLPRLQDAGIEPRVLRFVEDAARHASCMAVLHTDLDNFGLVNRDFGEPAGDAVLKEFAARFRSQFAEIGVVVRTGGEEFSAFLFPKDAGQILERSEAFRALMEAAPFKSIKRVNTCSIGLAIYADALAVARLEMKALLHDAREAERRAKSQGRNRIRLPALPGGQATDVHISHNDLIKAALLARLDLHSEQPRAFSTQLGNVVAMLLARRVSNAGLDSVADMINHVTDSLELTIGVDTRSTENAKSLPLSANLSAAEWAAIVAWALLHTSFATVGPLSPQDQLSFRVEVGGADAGVLLLEVTRCGSPVARLPLAPNVVTDGTVPRVSVGAPWYPSPSAPAGAVRRWVPTGRHAQPDSSSVLSPCLLLPIGDLAIELVADLRHLVAEVVEIDDRPVVGGGLPDFWQSNLARIIRACLRNPNIQFVFAIGAAENASHTLDWLRLTHDQWSDRLYSVQRSLSIGPRHLEAFRDRGMVVESVPADAPAVFAALLDGCRRIPIVDFVNRPFIDLDAEFRTRRLPFAAPAEVNRLLLTDGLRTRTLADAYPQAIQLLRSSSAPPQIEATRRRFREFSCFKLVMTSPFQEPIPDYWVDEATSLNSYYNRNFAGDGGLFGARLRVPLSDGRLVYDHALQATVDALKDARATRRILLPFPFDRFDQPLGLCAIHIMPRLREERWHLDFQWIWRTVEALVGFPFSAYGSITWSREFFDTVQSKLGRSAVKVSVERGELTYVALSFHMFLDVGDEEIARAIVLDASC
jgi:diguanylate cyclase (GGDEF)-like protein